VTAKSADRLRTLSTKLTGKIQPLGDVSPMSKRYHGDISIEVDQDMDSAATTVIEVRDLVKRYGEHKAVDGVSFTV
jgi:hypothetical protein